MSRAAAVAAAVEVFGALLYLSIHTSYGQNASNLSSLTIDQLRPALHTFQQLNKDNNAGNLTAEDLNNAHNACNQLKHSRVPMFMFHLCSSMPR
jgi:hypothetical protein